MSKEPRILYLDLETLPNLLEAMKVFPSLGDWPGRTLKATINSVICFGYKWHGKRTQVVSAWDFPKRWRRDVNDDLEVIRFAHAEIAKADAIVTYNGRKFDEKVLRTRFFVHNLKPLSPYAHIDLCNVLRSKLSLYSNSLKAAAPLLVGSDKLEHDGWPLWVRVSNRDKRAQGEMARYCKQDVELLQPLFRRLKPFIKDIPNYNNYVANPKRIVCPSCGSTRLRSAGWRTGVAVPYRRLTCLDCFSPAREMKDGSVRGAK